MGIRRKKKLFSFWEKVFFIYRSVSHDTCYNTGWPPPCDSTRRSSSEAVPLSKPQRRPRRRGHRVPDAAPAAAAAPAAGPPEGRGAVDGGERPGRTVAERLPSLLPGSVPRACTSPLSEQAPLDRASIIFYGHLFGRLILRAFFQEKSLGNLVFEKFLKCGS